MMRPVLCGLQLVFFLRNPAVFCTAELSPARTVVQRETPAFGVLRNLRRVQGARGG